MEPRVRNELSAITNEGDDAVIALRACQAYIRLIAR